LLLGRRKREKSEEKEKEKKEKWPIGPRKWASQGWAELGKTCHEF
jgi:hypothetical protein